MSGLGGPGDTPNRRSYPPNLGHEEGGRFPNLAIELLSPSTEGNDRGDKFVKFRDDWKMGDYFLFDTDLARLEGFNLERSAYVTTRPDERGRHRCQTLPLSLGVHAGWLRWFDLEGQMLPTDEELAETEHQRAETEHQRAETERQRAERLATRLRELGLEPE